MKYGDSEKYCTDTGTGSEAQWCNSTKFHEIAEKLYHVKFWFVIFRYNKYGKIGKVLCCLGEINDKQFYSLDHIYMKFD